MWQSRIDGDDHYDPDIEARDVLLMLKPLVRCQKHVEGLRSAPEQLAVLHGRPAFFLHRPDLEIGEIAAELARQIFVEENPPHAI